MSGALVVPAATLLREQPETALAATPAGSAVHILNRPGGHPICRRDPTTVRPLPPGQPPPPLRVCAFCIRALPARLRITFQPTDEERTAVHEHAERRRPDPVQLPDTGDG